jgi:iron(III) transport system permease protein
MAIEQRDATLVRAVATSVVALFSLLPVLAALAGAFGADLALLAGSRIWVLLLRTCLRATAVSILALLVGVPLGAAFARLRIPFRGPLLLLHLLPACLPPLLLALGWFHLFGRSGVLGSDLSATLLFGEAGAIGVLALALAPIITASAWLGIGSVDASLEEAGLIVAPPLVVLRRIMVPAAWPAITMGGLLVFVLAFGELAVPMFLRVDSYSAAVFSRLGGIDYAPGEAAVLVLPLIPIAVLLFALERRFLAPRLGAVAGRSERAPLRFANERWIGALVSAAALLPVVSIAGLCARADFTASIRWIGPSVGNSVLAGGTAAAIITALAAILAPAIARESRIGRFADAVSVVVFIVPPAVLAVGIIDVWNRPALRPVYGTIAIVIVGFVARYGIVGIRTLGAALVRSPPSLEDAARSMGASHLRILFRILLPMHARAVLGAFVLALLFCLRDVEAAIAYYPPGGETLPVRIFTLEANGPEAVVAALAVMQVLLTVFLIALASLLHRAAR